MRWVSEHMFQKRILFLIIAIEAGGILAVFIPMARKKNVIAWGSFSALLSITV